MDYLEKLNEMFEELVPGMGAADTKAGELVRAVSRIGYRFYNDGDKIGVDYGNETCNPAARYIIKEYDDEDFSWTVNGMWGLVSDAFYEKGLNLLMEQVVKYLENHPELKEEVNEGDYEDDYVESEDLDWWAEKEEEDVWEEPMAVYEPEPKWEEE